MYWSDIAEPAKIEAARHDGTHRVIVALNLTNPNSITIDYLNSQLIWLDSSRLTIEVANLDGTYRSVLTDRNMGQPFAVAEFGNYVWFTEWEQNHIVQVDKTDRRHLARLRGSFNKPSGIQVVHPKSKQIGSKSDYKILSKNNNFFHQFFLKSKKFDKIFEILQMNNLIFCIVSPKDHPFLM